MNKSTINLILNILFLVTIVAIVYISMVPNSMINLLQKEQFNEHNKVIEEECPIQGGLASGDKTCSYMTNTKARIPEPVYKRVPVNYNDPNFVIENSPLLSNF